MQVFDEADPGELDGERRRKIAQTYDAALVRRMQNGGERGNAFPRKVELVNSICEKCT